MKAYLDRFENDRAVLIFEKGKENVFLPRKLLPAACKEGDILTFFVKIDKSETQKRRKEIKQLQAEAGSGSQDAREP